MGGLGEVYRKKHINLVKDFFSMGIVTYTDGFQMLK